MRKIFTLFALAGASYITASAQQELLSTVNSYVYEQGMSVPSTPDASNKYFYNENNELVSELNIKGSSNEKYTYEYNEDGSLKSVSTFKKDKSYTPFSISEKKEYVYDSENRLEEVAIFTATGEVKNYLVYLYENGGTYYSDVKTYNATKETCSTWEKHRYEFDENNLVVKEKLSYYYESRDSEVDGNYYTFEYEEGILVKKSTFNKNNVETEKIVYSYEDGKCVKETITNRTANITDKVLTYSTYSADFAPVNLSAEILESHPVSNSVKFTWEAPANTEVDGYTVYVGSDSKYVSETECVFESLPNGVNSAFVVAMVGNTEKNRSSEIDVEVEDKNMVPASNLRIESSSISTGWSNQYTINFEWEKPETTSEIIGYIFTDFNSSEVTVTTESYSKTYMAYQVEVTDENGVEVGIDFSVSVKVIYATGVSEPSEQLVFNPYIFATGIEGTVAEGSGITIYPNPATEVIFFSQPSAAYVYSMDGSLVISSASAVNSLDVTSLVKGSYVVKTVTDSKVSTQIIIKK